MRAPLLLLALLAAGCDGPGVVKRAEEPHFQRLSADTVEHGQRVADIVGCTGCHDRNLQGRDWSDEFGTLWTANLTRSVEKHSDEELLAMVLTGQRADRELHGMPSHVFTKMHADDLAAILAFLRSKPPAGDVHPEPIFGPELLAMLEEGTLKSAATEVAEMGAEHSPDLGEEHALGRYIVRATCAECHGIDLRGGTSPFPGDVPRPDLRIAASYDRAAFERLMRTGKAAGDREIGLMSTVARGRFSQFTDEELAAVHDYLVALSKTGE